MNAASPHRFSTANWPFIVKFGVPCLLAVTVVILLGMIALNTIDSLQSTLNIVVARNFNASVLLAESVQKLEAANGDLYQMQTKQAVGLKPKIAENVNKITQALDQVIVNLNTYKAQYASAEQSKKIDEIIANIGTHKEGVAFVGSMMEIDFKATVNFLIPLAASYDARIADLSAFSEQSLADSHRQMEAAVKTVINAKRLLTEISIPALLLLMFITFWIAAATVRSVRELAAATKLLAQGDTNVDIEHLARSDELGHIVEALDVFRRLQQLVIQQTQDLKEMRDRAENANRAKSEFLAKMSHELRTPMHAILSFSRLSLKRVEPLKDERLTTILENIQISGKRLLDLLNGLLDLSKLEARHTSFSFKTDDLTRALDQTLLELEPLFSAKQVNVRVQKEGVDTVVDYDSKLMVQVFINILSNAIKYSPETAEIGITFLSNAMHNGSPTLMCRIQDQGRGIPPGELESIFEKFVQSSHTATSNVGGTGLGLAIVREIMDAHGGKIWAENCVPCGSCFVLVLPRENPSCLKENTP